MTPPPLPEDGSLVLEIDGVAVRDVKAWYANSLLTLYTGSDPDNDPGHALRIWSMPSVPSEQVLRYPSKDAGFASRVSYERDDRHDRAANIASKDLDAPRFELALSKPEPYSVAIAVDIEADKPFRVRARGKITAMTRGIKMTDGEVDRSFDHLDTIQYLTRTWIEKHHKTKQLGDRPDYCMMTRGDTPQVAACSFLFLDERGKLGAAKLWLEKRDGRWLERAEVKPDQLMAAHSIRAPFDRRPYAFEPMAAARFEREIYQRSGSFRRIFEPISISCSGGRVAGETGWCEIGYDIAPKDHGLDDHASLFNCQRVTYLFEVDEQDKFRITRTLGSNERFDAQTGAVVPREPSEECRKER